MENMKKNIRMKCSVCGNDQFSVVTEGLEDLNSAPGEAEVKCSDCGRVTTKDQLIEDNEYIIESNIEDLKKEFIKQLNKDIKKRFK